MHQGSLVQGSVSWAQASLSGSFPVDRRIHRCPWGAPNYHWKNFSKHTAGSGRCRCGAGLGVEGISGRGLDRGRGQGGTLDENFQA